MRVNCFVSALLGLTLCLLSTEGFVELDKIHAETNLTGAPYDVVIFINDDATSTEPSLNEAMTEYSALKQPITSGLVVPLLTHPSKHMIVGLSGLLNKDYADSRLIYKAGATAAKKMIELNVRRPLVVVGEFNSKLPHQKWATSIWPKLTALLGILSELYVPLQVRESRPHMYPRYDDFGVYFQKDTANATMEEILNYTKAMEEGLYVTRDICATDEEQMAPPAVEKYILEHFKPNDNIQIDSQPINQTKYPTMHAVNRVNKGVEKYQGRVIKLTYLPPGGAKPETDETLFVIGKGITFDSGGLSVKTSGNMKFMRNDKCGAAAVAGFIKVLEKLQPAGLTVYGRMAYVRNGIGSEAYAVDEIIPSGAGVRSLIGNTDAEGRNVMVDLLAEALPEAVKMNIKNPHFMSLATLTGAQVSAFGTIPAVVDNGPARVKKYAKDLCDWGMMVGDPGQISSLRREDFENVYPVTQYEDLQQRNTHPGTIFYRGHQYPMAWMIMASKLNEHGLDSEGLQIPYTHVDIAGAVGVSKPDERATGTPTSMLVSTFVLQKLHKEEAKP